MRKAGLCKGWPPCYTIRSSLELLSNFDSYHELQAPLEQLVLKRAIDLFLLVLCNVNEIFLKAPNYSNQRTLLPMLRQKIPRIFHPVTSLRQTSRPQSGVLHTAPDSKMVDGETRMVRPEASLDV